MITPKVIIYENYKAHELLVRTEGVGRYRIPMIRNADEHGFTEREIGAISQTLAGHVDELWLYDFKRAVLSEGRGSQMRDLDPILCLTTVNDYLMQKKRS